MNATEMPGESILVVDDEEDVVQGCRWMLESGGFPGVIGCTDSRGAMDILAGNCISLVLLDLFMPDVPGEEILAKVVDQYPHIPVIIVTGINELNTAVRCMKAGAFDYLVKPVEETRLVAAVKRALDLRELRNEYASFKRRVLMNALEHPKAFEHIVTQNAAMHSMFQYAETIALTPRPILVTGETGVGKELVARAIHNISRPGKPFVAVNVAGLDDNMFSDTLFGHVRGAFTGADKPRQGLIERAAGGTLFLDEIGDLEAASQIKLLRVLQENEFLPLGADAARPSEARIIVATNRDLNALQEAGRFRRDLYYRLQTHSINIPPLRERLDDVPLLTHHFVEHAARVLHKDKPVVPGRLFAILKNYAFPGNVRELEGMVFDAVSRHRSGDLSCDGFRDHVLRHGGSVGENDADHARAPDLPLPERPVADFPKLPTLPESPVLLIKEALNRTSGNQSTAARLLGITRSGLCKAMKRYGISPDFGRYAGS